MSDNKSFFNCISISKIAKYIIASLLVSLINVNILQSQQQWKFHVAFEDGIGARDTIWFIWDTTATYYGADSLLGEISAEINLDEFNVWTYNKGLTWQDSIKTVALPFNYKFTQTLYASSFILPITITYDTSLFYADWLPQEPVGFVNIATISNAYFYLLGFNDLQYWDMHFSDSVVSPDYELVGNDPWSWDPNHNFPMGIALGQDSIVNIKNLSEINVNVFPNPAKEKLMFTLTNVNTSNEKYYLSVYNVDGKLVDKKVVKVELGKIVYDITEFNAGVYIYSLNTANFSANGKFVVTK